MRRVSIEERRARLGRRHRLLGSARTDDVVAITSSLVGLHSSDPATVVLSAAARMRTPSVAAVESALYDDRVLVRTLCMRRTMFVVPVELVPVVQAACTDALVPGERRRTLQLLEGSGVRDAARVLRRLERATYAAIVERGEATGAELARLVPGLDHKIPVGEGKKWAGTIGVSTRVLFLLSTEQRIVRGRPKGSWTSSQYRWAPITAWLPDGVPSWSADEARVELVRRWLLAFGPGTVADIKWWSGLTMGAVRKALATLDAEEVDLGGTTGVSLPGDGPVRPLGRPWVALLPGLDATTMGWQQREWYLGEHGPAVFDRNGNAGPTVWADGRVIGGWSQRATGEIAFRLLEDVGSDVGAAVGAEAARLEAWLGDVRVTPRFPTPLQRELLD
ncbi:MAG: hypothetical protein QOE35_2172 [Actinomycetota bacterium]